MEFITFKGSNENLFSRTKLSQSDLGLNLIVPETHNAILVKDGQMLQTLSSGKYKISNFVDEKEDCNLEILFMSKTAKLKLLWGTAEKFLLYDFESKQNYRVGFSGDFEVQIGDPRKCYLFLIGVSDDLTSDALQERLMSNVVSILETEVGEYINENKLGFSQLSLFKKQISAKVLKVLKEKMLSEYGISVFSFNISNIIIDNEDFDKLGNKFESCKFCGATLDKNAKFCPVCGKKLSNICPNCQKENLDDAKFCSNCGQKLS